MKNSTKLTALLAFALPLSIQASFGQTNAASPETVAPKSGDEIKMLIGNAYQRNEVTSIDGGYHLLATFETFTADGQPDGDGSIERWTLPSKVAKTVTKFRGHIMTQYFPNGPSSHFTDDGYSGNIMSYFVNMAVFYAAFPSAAIAHRDAVVSTMALQGGQLDCGSFTLEIGPSGYPQPPMESFCISRATGDLALRQTEGLNIRYQDFAAFEDKSVARTVSASKDGQLRFSVHISQLDRSTLSEAEMTPPPSASLTSPQPNIWATQPGETTPESTQKIAPPQPLKSAHARGQVVLYVLISRTGDVTDVEPIYAASPELATYAIQLAKGYHYKPIMRNGEPISEIAHAWFTFKF